jgi:hypothetical protein
LNVPRYVEGRGEQTKHENGSNSEGAKKLNGEIQKRIRKDKENSLREKCREME